MKNCTLIYEINLLGHRRLYEEMRTYILKGACASLGLGSLEWDQLCREWKKLAYSNRNKQGSQQGLFVLSLLSLCYCEIRSFHCSGYRKDIYRRRSLWSALREGRLGFIFLWKKTKWRKGYFDLTSVGFSNVTLSYFVVFCSKLHQHSLKIIRFFFWPFFMLDVYCVCAWLLNTFSFQE